MKSKCKSAPWCPLSPTSAARRVAVDTSASPPGLTDVKGREDGLVEDESCQAGDQARADQGAHRRHVLRKEQSAGSGGRLGISAFGRVDDETLQRPGVRPSVPRLYSAVFPNFVVDSRP